MNYENHVARAVVQPVWTRVKIDEERHVDYLVYMTTYLIDHTKETGRPNTNNTGSNCYNTLEKAKKAGKRYIDMMYKHGFKMGGVQVID